MWPTRAITDSNKVIYGCYDSGGNLKVMPAGQFCAKGYTSVNWNQQGLKGDAGPQGLGGAQGPAGPTGATGPAGAQGVPGTSDALETTTVKSAVFPFPNIDWVVVSSLALPKGHYLVQGNAVITNNEHDNVTECQLFAAQTLAPGDGFRVGSLALQTVVNGGPWPLTGEATLSVSGLANLPTGTNVALECIANPFFNPQPPSGENARSIMSTELNAVTVSTVNGG